MKILMSELRRAPWQGDEHGNGRNWTTTRVTRGSDVRLSTGRAAPGDERPVQLLLTKGFRLGQHEVTQAECERVMQTTPWKTMAARVAPECRNIEAANHTFATAAWRDAVAEASAEWIDRHFGPRAPTLARGVAIGTIASDGR